MDTIASRYASALLELAIENDKVTSYQSQIKYVLNVFKENEVEENNNVQKIHVNNVKKSVPFYSLDVIIFYYSPL